MSDYVKFKACEVINAHNDAQVILVVQSTASVAVSLGSYGSTGTCTTSTLNPGFTRGCYGSTGRWSGTNWWISATLTLNGVPNTIVV
ncbi:hypothetical protein [Streptomyces avermitilis]|uniref:hypothetical protein n=1 Tax=Streptomyces avermitilis TaxID=33903 RepID=UPI0033ECE349